MSGTAAHAHLSAIVFTEKTNIVAQLGGLDDARFTAEVAKRLGSYLGEIELVGRRWTYPLAALHAARYIAPRLTLVGDAAHGIHPIAGQGLNLGLRDALALADLIAAGQPGTDPGAAALLGPATRRCAAPPTS